MTSSNIHLLEQGLALLAVIDDQPFAQAPKGIAQSGVGGHLRHCLDFYDSFLRGVGEGKIDYDCRERNVLIEKDRAAAATKIESIIRRLGELRTANGEQPLLVKLEGEQAGEAAAWSHSSISRELQFLLSHTVHHYALMAMLLRVQGVELPPEFGVAPSTLKYWRAKA
ncbi:MAG TPA: DinB family protein [Blastocatellia bacterium]|nr:DinB family protein [Blastocatellia bacterium]HMX29303.1 DinB family protein [Blastocatellia bacterium]HMY70829.1 DinB family protein [Blastocatellia bacterium]HMZ23162.1 DinB family protein [Blastocatellia bacterium]HNG30988.1 DinB family protein [Blastocatellia bacterium]